MFEPIQLQESETSRYEKITDPTFLKAQMFDELSDWQLCLKSAQETEGFQWERSDETSSLCKIESPEDWARDCMRNVADYIDGCKDDLENGNMYRIQYGEIWYWAVKGGSKFYLFPTVWHIC